MKVRAHFKRNLFYNEHNGYRVAKIIVDDQLARTVVITGIIPVIDKYKLYEFEGEYIEHEKFGRQFSVETYNAIEPTDKETIIKYLSSPIFEGIGSKTAERIYDEIGPECIEIIKEDYSAITDIKGITEDKAVRLSYKLSEENELVEGMRFFIEHGINTNNIGKIAAIYGSKLIEVIMENPYQLVHDIETINFKVADNIAVKIGFDLASSKRFEAAILYAIKNICFESGNTYVDRNRILKETMNICEETSSEDIDLALDTLIKNKYVIVDEGKYFHTDYYRSEVVIAETLNHRFTSKVKVKNLPEIIKTVQGGNSIQYTDAQLSSIKSTVENGFSILTGGPGTGKTTVTKAIIETYKAMSNDSKIALCAPTGRAARRMSEVTRMPAVTIHKLLK
jgi:exodeoxyribonuclease V alpha subunit